MRAIPFHSSRENVMWLNMWHLIDRNATSVDSSSLGNSEKKCEKISLNFPSSTAPHRLTTEHEPFLYRQIMDEYFRGLTLYGIRNVVAFFGLVKNVAGYQRFYVITNLFHNWWYNGLGSLCMHKQTAYCRCYIDTPNPVELSSYGSVGERRMSVII